MPRLISRRALLAGILALACTRAGAAPGDRMAAAHRSIWVWNTAALLSPAATARFVADAKALGLTDAYLFLRAADYTKEEGRIAALLEALSAAGIRAWGMEGWRGYFSDVEGPAGLYAAVDAMIAFNGRHRVKFAGFMSDLEPQDGQGEGQDLFVNDVPQSRLTPEQLARRDRILAEWLGIHETILGKMQAAGLQYGAAVPSWVDDYFGEPVEAVFKGVRKPLIEHLMPLVPLYVIMSYTTDPARVLNRIEGEMAYAAERLPDGPRVLFGLETHAGPGAGVSYADTPPKNRRSAVRSDLATIDMELGARWPRSHLGWSLHDYEGWAALPA
ncbi:hypothetical protein [Enterovirga sp. CN4-39]|uniref:hypothetical protein n=1 Tax=Enterovirga sp. CN4-39 TaxID=3400910 RepID=UPI003C00A7BD